MEYAKRIQIDGWVMFFLRNVLYSTLLHLNTRKRIVLLLICILASLYAMQLLLFSDTYNTLTLSAPNRKYTEAEYAFFLSEADPSAVQAFCDQMSILKNDILDITIIGLKEFSESETNILGGLEENIYSFYPSVAKNDNLVIKAGTIQFDKEKREVFIEGNNYVFLSSGNFIQEDDNGEYIIIDGQRNSVIGYGNFFRDRVIYGIIVDYSRFFNYVDTCNEIRVQCKSPLDKEEERILVSIAERELPVKDYQTPYSFSAHSKTTFFTTLTFIGMAVFACLINAFGILSYLIFLRIPELNIFRIFGANRKTIAGNIACEMMIITTLSLLVGTLFYEICGIVAKRYGLFAPIHLEYHLYNSLLFIVLALLASVVQFLRYTSKNRKSFLGDFFI